MVAARVLGPSDVPSLLPFLEAHGAVSMFLRNNLAIAGIVDAGRRFQGTWAGSFDGEDQLVGVAALFWNGNLVVCAPSGLAEVVACAVAAAPRKLGGFIGPWNEVVAARHALGLDERPTRLSKKEDLFRLALGDLRVPDFAGRTVRRGVSADVPALIVWRRDYEAESTGGPVDADPETSRPAIEATIAEGNIWVVCEDGEPVGMTALNARSGDWVQVGGVFTPPAARGKGLGRIAVAGSLLDAREGGAHHAVLFTGDDNVAARTAYLALGFQRIGDYALIFLAD